MWWRKGDSSNRVILHVCKIRLVHELNLKVLDSFYTLEYILTSCNWVLGCSFLVSMQFCTSPHRS